MRRRRSYAMRAVQWLLLVIAVSCLGFYCYSYLERQVYQTYDAWTFDQTADVPPSTALPARAAKKTAPAFSSIGRVSIPRLGLSAMVREGTDTQTLRVAVGHISSTPLPGESGNVALAGHRDTFFRELKNLDKNDTIDFSTHQGDFKYRVDEIMVVSPENTGVLKASEGNTLTLVTCFPFQYIGNAPKRFIVRARQIQ
jgi:sortase A